MAHKKYTTTFPTHKSGLGTARKTNAIIHKKKGKKKK